MLIIPRTQVASAKPHPCHKFTGEDHAGIDQTAEYEVMAAHETRQRGKQGGETVYGEHPDRSRTRKMEVSSAKSAKSSEYEFQKPAQ